MVNPSPYPSHGHLANWIPYMHGQLNVMSNLKTALFMCRFDIKCVGFFYNNLNNCTNPAWRPISVQLGSALYTGYQQPLRWLRQPLLFWITTSVLFGSPLDNILLYNQSKDQLWLVCRFWEAQGQFEFRIAWSYTSCPYRSQVYWPYHNYIWDVCKSQCGEAKHLGWYCGDGRIS